MGKLEYFYNAESKELLGSTEAGVDPVETEAAQAVIIFNFQAAYLAQFESDYITNNEPQWKTDYTSNNRSNWDAVYLVSDPEADQAALDAAYAIELVNVFNQHVIEVVEAELLTDPMPEQAALDAVVVYVASGCSTLTVPVDLEAGKVLIFDVDANVWVNSDDNRGSISYFDSTGESKLIDYIGDIESGYSLVNPEIAPSEPMADTFITEYLLLSLMADIDSELAPYIVDSLTVIQLKLLKMEQAKARYEKAMWWIKRSYTATEMDTWPRQSITVDLWDQYKTDNPAVTDGTANYDSAGCLKLLVMGYNSITDDANLTIALMDSYATDIKNKMYGFDIILGSLTGIINRFRDVVDGIDDDLEGAAYTQARADLLSIDTTEILVKGRELLAYLGIEE